MMRSMYSAVSGLRNHQTRMDVIGNNIANVNTAGYKKSRVVFKDALYQTIRGASRPTDARGGTNPMGVGLGMTLASIDQIHTPSPTTTTNKLTDMAVDGNGYFIVANGEEEYYTRAGNFDFDVNGNLYSTSNGYRVKGWMANNNKLDATGDWAIDTTGATVPIDISTYKTVAPRATTSMEFTGNLDSDIEVNQFYTTDDPPVLKAIDPATDVPKGTAAVVTEKDVYDSLGNKMTVYFRFFKAGTNVSSTDPTTYDQSQWFCDISLDPDFPAGTGFGTAFGADQPTIRIGALDGTNNIKFTTEGKLDPSSIKNINLLINRSASGAENMNVNIDFSQLTQYNNKSTAWAETQDGYTQGDLTSYTVGTDGIIKGVYSNGEVRNLARVAIANFQNPGGLLQCGGTMFQVSNNSGDARIGAPGEQGMGAIIPGSLEMSNVDLSEEFTDMIVTQRGFQANSRIITTSDEMLQELVNLKR
jgi:flagellar hook protein FlgE